MKNNSFEESIRSEFDVLLRDFGFRYSSTCKDEYFDNCEILYMSGDYILSVARERGSLRMYFGIFSSKRQWLIEVLVRYCLQVSECGDGANAGSLLIASAEFHEFHEEYIRYKKILRLYLLPIIDMFCFSNADLCDKIDEFCAEYYKANLERLANNTKG